MLRVDSSIPENPADRDVFQTFFGSPRNQANGVPQFLLLQFSLGLRRDFNVIGSWTAGSYSNSFTKPNQSVVGGSDRYSQLGMLVFKFYGSPVGSRLPFKPLLNDL